MSRRNDASMRDDLLDQLLLDCDDSDAVEMGAMRGSLKKVLTERALIARSRRQRSNEAPLWRFFAQRPKLQTTGPGGDFRAPEAGN